MKLNKISMNGRSAPRRQQRGWSGCLVVGLLVLYMFHCFVMNHHVSIEIGESNNVIDQPVGSGSTLGHHRSQKYSLTKKKRLDNNHRVAEVIDPCDVGTNASSIDGSSNSIIDDSVYIQWSYIDNTIHREFPKERVSGGIFLYPRQSAILTHLIRRIHKGLLKDDGRGKDPATMTICETGYGSGHSMALFQEASRSIGPVRVVSFDKFDRPYQLPIWNFINRTSAARRHESHQYQQQHQHFAGNSCKTVPKLIPKIPCDFLHGSSLCPTDNIDLVEHTPCGILLTSTAMGSLGDHAVYFGEKAQWRKLRDRGCISNIVCFREDGAPLERDYIFAKKGAKRTDEFCLAVTTGRCQDGKRYQQSAKCKAKVDRLVRQLRMDEICPRHQIKAPA